MWMEKGTDANLFLGWWGWNNLPVKVGEVLSEVRKWSCDIDGNGTMRTVRVRCAIKKTDKGYKIWWPTWFGKGKYKINVHLLLPDAAGDAGYAHDGYFHNNEVCRAFNRVEGAAV